MPRAVLGIDAAWTARHPSGVALVVETAGQWRLAALAPSYAAFCLSPDDSLVAATRRHVGLSPAVVAVDMPLSRQPIVGRRPADDAVSRAFGRFKCGTHSPTPERPGDVGHRLGVALAREGCPLATLKLTPPCAIEVYPHPALIRLTGASVRLPYKCGRSAQYWPETPLAERQRRLRAVWAEIIAALEGRIAGVSAALPLPPPTVRGAALKAFEDQLDAVVCAHIGIEALCGRAQPYGDADAAVWVPD